MELFPDTKGECKTDCEVSSTIFFCYKWCQYRGVFLSQSSIYDGTFYKISLWLSGVNYFRKKHHLRCSSGFWMGLCSSFRKTRVSIWDQGFSIKNRRMKPKVRKKAQKSQRRGLDLQWNIKHYIFDYVNDLESLWWNIVGCNDKIYEIYDIQRKRK